MIAIVDYGMGNVRSVSNALEYLGIDRVVTDEPAVIEAATRLILPGVGAFGDAMTNLRDRGLVEILHEQVLEERKPFLGICLGMQLLATSSVEHGSHQGLGWFDAEARRFPSGAGLKIPHLGWNDIEPRQEHPLFAELRAEEFVFYFVHSFHVVPRRQEVIAATCEHGESFAAALAKDNIFATQFHPEKSQDSGLQILENFAAWQP